MFINFIIAFAVSSRTAPPPSEVQEMVESIRIPKGAGKATGH
jgi:cation/acetate symporter